MTTKTITNRHPRGAGFVLLKYWDLKLKDKPHKEELKALGYWRLKVNDMVNGAWIATLLVAALMMIGGGCGNGAPWVFTPIG